MLRRPAALFLVCCMMLTFCLSRAELTGGVLQWLKAPGLVCPGVEQEFICAVPDGQEATLTVLDIGDTEVTLLREHWQGGSILWDGWGLEPDTYTLRLQSGAMTADTSVTVGAPVAGLKLEQASEYARTLWTAGVNVTLPGELTGTLEDGTQVLKQQVGAGQVSLSWDAASLSAGKHRISLVLTTADDVSKPLVCEFTVAAPSLAVDEQYYTPAEMTGVTCPHERCYWRMNMGEMDEAALWEELTAPITVLSGHERHQIKIRKEPSEKCTVYTGQVTGESQGVHVLERGEEWSLIQAYSSSVEGSRVAVYAKPFTGYVKTELLKERQVSQKTGIVIDKLQQRLYVFKDGSLFSTLLCSTGFSKSSTPFNETPAGEFVCQSWTGGFWSGSLWCDYGIRINDGILLHEVPVLVTTREDGTQVKDEQRCEQYLGEKASHGCIRIQRKSTPQGVNMKWLWDNLSRGDSAPTKVIIWDEVGRTLAYPDDGVTLYYNRKGGTYYHSSAVCQGVRSNYLPLSPFTYGQLNEKPFSRLTACPYCAPQLTHKGIDTVNKKNTRHY